MSTIRLNLTTPPPAAGSIVYVDGQGRATPVRPHPTTLPIGRLRQWEQDHVDGSYVGVVELGLPDVPNWSSVQDTVLSLFRRLELGDAVVTQMKSRMNRVYTVTIELPEGAEPIWTMIDRHELGQRLEKRATEIMTEAQELLR